MNTSPDSIYLVGNCNSSKEEYYPENTSDNFRIKLIKPLVLNGNHWKVALCEIHVVNVVLENKTVEERIPYFQVEFGPCEGILIDGHPTHTVRM